MADAYFDDQATDDTGDGLGWATAKLTPEAADVVTGAGGRIFGQNSSSGGFVETQATTKTYTSVGTKDQPVQWIACKSGTTNEPPVTADLVLDRDGANLALLQVTGGANDMNLAGFVDLWGFKLDAVDDIFTPFEAQWVGHHCIISCKNLRGSGTLILMDESELATSEPINLIHPFIMDGGEITGATTILANMNLAAGMSIVSGVDMSALAATAGIDISSAGSGAAFKIINSKIPVSYILVEGTYSNPLTRVTMIGCDSSADHTASIRQYRSETGQGFIVDDTPFISGGAQDRDSGDGYSFSMNLNDNTVLERVSPLYTEWFEVPLDGSETSLTLEFLRKDTGAPADVFNDMVWIEYQGPNEGVGSATSQYAFQSSRVADPVASAVALTSSSVTWSSLGGQTAKKQKVVLAISPEYAGVARYRVAYAERGTSILLLYFDPLPTLA